MPSAPKREHAPLFAAGFHPLPLTAIRRFCVDAFQLSSTRANIMNGIETVVQRLEAAVIIGELWLDGGFLTEKIDPEDVDMVLRVAGAIYDSGTVEQHDVIDWINSNLKAALLCDSYSFFEYPDGHALHD